MALKKHVADLYQSLGCSELQSWYKCLLESSEFGYIEPFVTEIVKQGQDNARAESHPHMCERDLRSSMLGSDEVPKTLASETRGPDEKRSAASSPRANAASKKSNNKAGRPKNK